MNAAALDDLRAFARTGALCWFGVGALARELYDELAFLCGREPDFLCDNAPSKWGTSLRGRACISPTELAERGRDVAVLVTIRNGDGVATQLRSLGLQRVFVGRFDSGYVHLRGLDRGRHEQEEPRAEDARHANATALKREGKTPCSATRVEASTPPRIDPRGRWTLVTGASRGIGRQIALAMAGLGSHVLAHCRARPHADTLLQLGEGLPGRILPLAAELSREEDVERLLEEVTHHAPRLDFLFHNAALVAHRSEGFLAFRAEDYRSTYAVNVMAPARICQQQLPRMREAGFGRVVMLHSHIHHRLTELAYALSKAALQKLVTELVPTLEGTGVSLCCADPGWVRTDAGGPDAPHAVESVVPGVLLGALLDADVNGRSFSAQEYAGKSLDEALTEAHRRISEVGGRWI